MTEYERMPYAPPMAPSRLINRNVFAERGRTSIRFEPEFWDALEEIARLENCDFHEIVRRAERSGGARTSAVRVFVLGWYRQRVEALGIAP